MTEAARVTALAIPVITIVVMLTVVWILERQDRRRVEYDIEWWQTEHYKMTQHLASAEQTAQKAEAQKDRYRAANERLYNKLMEARKDREQWRTNFYQTYNRTQVVQQQLADAQKGEKALHNQIEELFDELRTARDHNETSQREVVTISKDIEEWQKNYQQEYDQRKDAQRQLADAHQQIEEYKQSDRAWEEQLQWHKQANEGLGEDLRQKRDVLQQIRQLVSIPDHVVVHGPAYTYEQPGYTYEQPAYTYEQEESA